MDIFVVGYVVIFLLVAIHAIYVRSLGLTLKSVSLKDIEITPSADEASILNRHLDEIIYFFQQTKYDLVVVEDVDRFNRPDVLVSLREINSLINANAGVKQRVRFIYALRDDIFKSTDRTKFFEFIVPIIPVINHSNSVDKVLLHIRRIGLDDSRLNLRFIREVSRYIADLRLIQNVFNEYIIYSTNLRADSDEILDPNKLLAVLIYKNVLPHDFALLHEQEGMLYSVFARYDEYVSRTEGGIRERISGIEADIAKQDEQSLRGASELRKAYAMAVIERIPPQYTVVHWGGHEIALGQLAEHPELETILVQKSLPVGQPNSARRVSIEIGDVQAALDPANSFKGRKEEIESRTAGWRTQAEEQVQAYKRQLSSLRTTKVNEVIRQNVLLIEEVFAGAGKHSDLLRYLVLEGHLDDTYYQYTSLFHAQRLSPNDDRFLRTIRSYRTPSPDFALDNVSEVVESMRVEDFGHTYVLNVVIVDHLFDDVATNAPRIEAACSFISEHFSECREFFESYYAKGRHVHAFVSTLTGRWLDFVSVALASEHSALHAAHILAYADISALLPAQARELADYLGGNALAVLGKRVEFKPNRLKELEVRISDVPSIAGYPEIVSFIAGAGLYRITIENLAYIMHRIVKWPSLEGLKTRHFSTILEANDAAVLARVRSEFAAYVEDVLLKIEGNTSESVPAILEVLEHDGVNRLLREEYVLRQSTTLPTFDGVPPAFYALLVAKKKIEPRWGNCAVFLNSDDADPTTLVEFLEDPEVVVSLTAQALPEGDDGADLREFIVENDDLEIEAYEAYVSSFSGVLTKFPEVSEERVLVLIEHGAVAFNAESIQQLQSEDLVVEFIAKNAKAYFVDPSVAELTDAMRAKLLVSGMPTDDKMRVIAEIDPEYVAGHPAVAAEIGNIVERSPLVGALLGPRAVKSVVANSRPQATQVSLLNRLYGALSNDDVRDLLSGFEEPLRSIASYGKSPRIDNTERHRQLAHWLKERGMISSFAEARLGDGIRINTFKKPQL